MTFSTTDRRIVLPEWVMPYLLAYGDKFDCDDLPTIIGRVVADHKMAGLGFVPVATGQHQPVSTRDPVVKESRFKLS